jgi:ParB/RepB/Spo0J family partition protein
MPKTAPRQPKQPAAPSLPTTERTTVPLERIHLSPLNPRTEFPMPGIRDLAATIERDGLIQALTVRPSREREGCFEIAAGERRFRALEHLQRQGKISGDWPVPVQVREMDDSELLTLALVENLLREDLHPLDEAYAYQRLAEQGVRTAEIARRVRRTQRHVQLRLKLTGLDARVQKAFRTGEITLAQARALATAPPELHVPAFEAFRKWPNLYQDPAHLMGLLTRDTFPQSEAAFAPREYTGPIVEDPETGERHYADLGQVRRLQTRAAERLRRELEAKTRHPVEVVEGPPEEIWTRFQPAAGRGSHTAITVSPSGELEVLENLVPVGKAKAAVPAEPEDDVSTVSVTLRSQAQRRRNGALQEAVAGDAAVALRLALVGLLQEGWGLDAGLAFGPARLTPPSPEGSPVAALARAELSEALGKKLVPEIAPEPRSADGDVLALLSGPEEVARAFRALLAVPDDAVLRLLTRVVAARTGSPAIRPGDAPLARELARHLAVTADPAGWLDPELLGLYRKPHLIRLAKDSGAVPKAKLGELEALTKEEIVERILASETRDPDYLPPELRFEEP